MRFGRNVLILACTAAAVTPLVADLPQATAASSKPSFTTKLLAGSSGFSEPRVTVTPDGSRYVDTNAERRHRDRLLAAPYGLTWKQVPGTPPGQTNPTTDVDIVSTRTGRLVASELDFTGINFITAYSDDKGATWKSSTGTTYADTDRQWFAVGPDDATTPPAARVPAVPQPAVRAADAQHVRDDEHRRRRDVRSADPGCDTAPAGLAGPAVR